MQPPNPARIDVIRIKYLFFDVFKKKEMLSRSVIRFIKSLQLRKYRQQEQSFVVEGAKSVREVLHSDFSMQMLLATGDFLRSVGDIQKPDMRILEVEEKDLVKVGSFETNNTAVAIVRMPPNKRLGVSGKETALALDGIRDPGNLGSIIRTADWYGIMKIIASNDCVDLYNQKVIQATMGSFLRVAVYYTDLSEYLSSASVPVLGTFLEGEDLHTFNFGSGCLVVIGNESGGISGSVERHIISRISIPRFGKAESLNAAMATAVVCDNLRRSQKNR